LSTVKKNFFRRSENVPAADLTPKVVCEQSIAGRDPAGMMVRDEVVRIYEVERANIYSYLLHFGLPAARAQELTQDAFLKLYLKLSEGVPIANSRAWLYRVAHNLALRSHARERKFGELDPDAAFADTRPDPERILIDKRRRSALRNAIRHLSPQQRNCLHLRVQGLGYREIAEVIGISTSAVGEFLRRARERLKEALRE
jgi:RNA polymerase sigma-70 factor, ECF subfamily